MIDKNPVFIATVKGLPMYRRFLKPGGHLVNEFIEVTYEEYLLTPDGSEIEKEIKSYLVKDKPAVYHQAGELQTEATYDENGNELTPAVYYDGTELITAATTSFSDLFAQIGVPMKALVDARLATLPVDVPNKYVL